jgi:hypothetical protein
MVYFTVRNTSGGFYGHQLKDWIGGYTLGKLLNLNYVHTYYPYLEYFGLGMGKRSIQEIDCKVDSIVIKGPYWDGINFDLINDIRERYAEYELNNRDLLIYFENALRLFPYKVYEYNKSGLLKNNLFDEITYELTKNFESFNRNTNDYFDNSYINIALQIRLGDANDKKRHPEHFTNPMNVRYQYPMEHYVKIINSLNNIKTNKPKQFHIYTDGYKNEGIGIFNHFKNVQIHCSFEENRNANSEAYEDFLHMVRSDLLVATTSSFSSMAAHFRRGKITLYHPHKHLPILPDKDYLAIDVEGSFEKEPISEYFFDGLQE